MSRDDSLPVPDHKAAPRTLTRRHMVRLVGGSMVALPLLGQLAGCGEDEAEDPVDASAATDGGIDGSPEPDAAADPDAMAADPDASADPDAAEGDPDAGDDVAWATGGVAAMIGADSYPNPFTDGLADDACALTCQLTLGPCYAPSAPVRQDVSEGEAGIPMRLMIRIVEADGCTPVEGVEVEIWYCNIDGLYSGNDVNQGDFCTGGDEFAEAAYFARGRAIADADGTVTFDTCYPGWYPSRAVHVHFLVRRPEFVGGVQDTQAAVVSQLFFDEALTAEIFSGVEGYQQKGQPDTTHANDTVIGGVDEAEQYIGRYAKMADGAMLTWLTVAISDDESCGGGGGGPGGGMPPGGMPPPG